MKPPKAKAATAAAAAGAPARAAPALVFAACFAAFLPVLSNGFVAWDDAAYLVNNPDFRGFGAANLRWMFTTVKMGNWHPLVWLTYALDYRLWGLAPRGYHLSNLLLHAASALLFFFIARRLLRAALPGAGGRALAAGALFAALLFGAHPLRAESVAWASERKDVLCAFFYLLSVLCWLKARAGEAGRWGAFSLAAFALALMSKSMAVSLPFLLLALDYYPLRRSGGWLRALREKATYLLLAAAASVAAMKAQRLSGAVTDLEQWGLARRVAQSAYGLFFYAAKTVWPSGLSPVYPPPTPFDPLSPAFLLAGFGVAAFSAAAWALRGRLPALLSAWVSYVVVLLPVLGLVSIGPQFVADRYSYLACLPPVLFAGAWLAAALDKAAAAGKGAAAPLGAALALCLVYGGLAYRQALVWKDTESLWTRALAVDPGNYLAHNYLALELADQGRDGEALAHYAEALRLKPAYADAHYNLATLLPRLGRAAEAEEQYRLALGARPGFPEAHHNLAVMLEGRGLYDEAFAHYARALELRPDYALAHYNIANAYLRRRDPASAAAHFAEALRLRPDLAPARAALEKLKGGR